MISGIHNVVYIPKIVLDNATVGDACLSNPLNQNTNICIKALPIDIVLICHGVCVTVSLIIPKVPDTTTILDLFILSHYIFDNVID